MSTAPGAGRLRLRELRSELIVLALLWLVAAVVFFLLAERHVTPRRHQDEFFYWGIAKSLAVGDGVSWRGASAGLRSFLYPLLIAPVFRLSGSVATQYSLVHAFNALAATAVVLPTWLMARPFSGHRMSLLAAAAALAIPTMGFVGIIGTESLAYPLSAGALAAIVLACARPGPRSTLLAFGLIALAVFVRIQFIVLPLVFLLALLLVAAFRGRGESLAYLRSQRFALIGLAVLAVVALIVAAAAGSRSGGIHGAAFLQRPHSLGELWFWLRSFAADSLLVVAVVPVIATWSLIGSREHRRDPLLGPLLAVAVATPLVLVAETSWFSAGNTEYWRQFQTFYERYIFYIAPPLLAAAAAAVGRLRLRPTLIATLLALCVMAGFSSEAVYVPFSYDAMGLAYLGFLSGEFPALAPHVTLFLLALTLLMAAPLIVAAGGRGSPELRQRAAVLAVALPLFVLVLSQAKAWSYAWIFSEDSLAGQPQPPDFAERAGSAPTALLAAGGRAVVREFQAEFWNPRIDRVYVNRRAPIESVGIHLNACQFEWERDGRLRATPCGPPSRNWYVAASDLTLRFRDQRPALSGSGTRTGTLLTTGAPRPTLLAMVKGMNVDSRQIDGGSLQVWSFAAHLGQLRVTFAPLAAGTRVELPGGRTVELTGRRVVERSLPGGQHVTHFAVRSGHARVEAVELREGVGGWTRIG